VLEEGAAANGRDNFGAALDIRALKASACLRICHELEYQGLGNRINSVFPGVFLERPFRVLQGELVQLSWTEVTPQ
jgi:hypothetical protein